MQRVGFGSKIGIILATAGSAVGLGNIWRFPTMTGQDGGSAFIILYLVCTLMLGIPGMIAEFIVGRHGASNALRAYSYITGKKWWAFRMDWLDLLAVQGTLKSLQHHSSKASILWRSSFFTVQLTPIHDYWKNQSFDYSDLCWQSNVSAF